MLVIPQKYIIKEGTSVVRQYKNARNLTGLNFASAGAMYVNGMTQIYHFNPDQAFASIMFGSVNVWQGLKNFAFMKFLKPQYKAVSKRANSINALTSTVAKSRADRSMTAPTKAQRYVNSIGKHFSINK